MFIEPGVFHLDRDEKIELSGDYEIKEIRNECHIDWETSYEHVPLQIIYSVGNVLYKKDTENIEDLIKLFIRYTHDSCDDVKSEFDFSIKSTTQMRWGTICPTKKVLFTYKSKVFVAYGRYIFGYDKSHVCFRRENEHFEDTDNSDDSDLDNTGQPHRSYNDRIKSSSIGKNEIILGVPKYEDDVNEYVYSFMIYDEKDNVLDAFGLYR